MEMTNWYTDTKDLMAKNKIAVTSMLRIYHLENLELFGLGISEQAPCLSQYLQVRQE